MDQLSVERERRAAVYGRVSTAEQVEGTSLGMQQRQCLSWIAAAGWRPSGVYIDEGVSGALGFRPKLDELMDACRRGQVDVIVVSRLDRFARSMRHLTAHLAELDELGVQFVSVLEGFDSASAVGRLQRNILGSFAEFERDLMIQRSQSGLRAIAAEGFWPGGQPPFGFQLEKAGRRSRLVINEVEAAVYRTAIRVIVDEQGTLGEATRTLHAMGFVNRAGTPFTYGRLRKALLGAPLSGTWLYLRRGHSQNLGSPGLEDPIAISIPEIISPERHLQLRARLDATRVPRRPDLNQYFYLLSPGFITGPCGGRFHGETTARTWVRRYVCRKNWPYVEERCTCRRVDGDRLDADVWDALYLIYTDPMFIAGRRRGETIDLFNGRPNLPLQLEKTEQRISQLEREMSHAALECLRAGLTAPAIAAVTTEYRNELEAAMRRRTDLQAQIAEVSAPERATLRGHAARNMNYLMDLSPDRRKGLLRHLDLQITIRHWYQCPRCAGSGRVGAPKGGANCPGCSGLRKLPQLTAEFTWHELPIAP